MRTCIGCRRRAPSSQLVRVVATGGGGLATGRSLPGRGAWLCAGSPDCLDAAAGAKAFSRALRSEVAIPAIVLLRTTLVERGRIEKNGHDRPPAGERT